MKITWIPVGLVASLAAITGCTATAQIPSIMYVQIPEGIRVSANQDLLLTVAATGDQIYTCQATADSAYEWTLKAPEAELFDNQRQLVGRHYGGPTWEMNDGSKVVGQLQQKVDASQADAIPWLLLQTKSQEEEGILSQANWIQRVNTVGGKAPAEGCDSMHENQEVRVNYSADYYFYK